MSLEAVPAEHRLLGSYRGFLNSMLCLLLKKEISVDSLGGEAGLT